MTMWHMWKGRNDLTFKGLTFKSDDLILLIKRYAFYTCLNFGLVHQTTEKLWSIDPSTAIERFSYMQKSTFISSYSETSNMWALCDGS